MASKPTAQKEKRIKKSSISCYPVKKPAALSFPGGSLQLVEGCS